MKDRTIGAIRKGIDLCDDLPGIVEAQRIGVSHLRREQAIQRNVHPVLL